MDIKDINFLDYGERDKQAIVLLHGWGQNTEMMDMLGRPFMEKYRIINIDLPGFGLSKEPPEPWGVEQYTDMVYKILSSLKVDKPILIGHSFGGRIAICYAAKYESAKVVLLSAPFRPKGTKNTKTSIKVKIYKTVKKIKFLKGFSEYLRNKWGSEDYKNASDINRGSLVKVVNEDLTPFAKEINVPVLLIYGKEDPDVLIDEARALEKIIPDCGLVEYERCHHYAYLEKLNDTILVLNNFFE